MPILFIDKINTFTETFESVSLEINSELEKWWAWENEMKQLKWERLREERMTGSSFSRSSHFNSRDEPNPDNEQKSQ